VAAGSARRAATTSGLTNTTGPYARVPAASAGDPAVCGSAGTGNPGSVLAGYWGPTAGYFDVHPGQPPARILRQVGRRSGRRPDRLPHGFLLRRSHWPTAD